MSVYYCIFASFSVLLPTVDAYTLLRWGLEGLNVFAWKTLVEWLSRSATYPEKHGCVLTFHARPLVLLQESCFTLEIKKWPNAEPKFFIVQKVI